MKTIVNGSNKIKKIGACLFLMIMITFPAYLFADSVNLPKTGQTKCYHQDGYELTDCADTGQDGDIQAGVDWPVPRFTDNGDGTITDHLTGLMWLKDAECISSGNGINWQDALDKAAQFNQDPASLNCYQYNYQALSYTDWRVPNINELESLVHAGKAVQHIWLGDNGFYNPIASDLWSSTTNNSGKSWAWVLDLGAGEIRAADKSAAAYYQSNRVILVRSAQ